MAKYSALVFTLIIFSLAAAGCDSGSDTLQVQDIVELRWQADGSSLYGFIQNYTQTQTSAVPSIAYSMVRFNNDGSTSQVFKTDPLLRSRDPVTGETEAYSPSLYLSPDGTTIVTQLENDLYRYTIKSGSLEKLQQQFHLIVVSPDLHYAVGTPSPSAQPIKSIVIYDIKASPIRKVSQFDLPGLVASSGIWLNGTFAITFADSIGSHISIFDSTGVLQQTVPGAEALFHNVVYNAQTNDLFFRNRIATTNDHFVEKINLTTMTRTNILKDSVDNFDVTRDENVIIYSHYDGNEELRAKNIQTGNVLQIANDIRLIIALSPAEDKLAYIRQRDANFTEVRIIPFTRP